MQKNIPSGPLSFPTPSVNSCGFPFSAAAMSSSIRVASTAAMSPSRAVKATNLKRNGCFLPTIQKTYDIQVYKYVYIYNYMYISMLLGSALKCEVLFRFGLLWAYLGLHLWTLFGLYLGFGWSILIVFKVWESICALMPAKQSQRDGPFFHVGPCCIAREAQPPAKDPAPTTQHT